MSGVVRVVAEAAQGFEGEAVLARLLVRAAAAGGADLVKFQLVYADELATPTYRHHDLFHRLEMEDAAWAAVRQEAAQASIGLAFDVFGERSLDLALTLNAKAVKIHASDFFNDELVDAALRRAPEVFLSAGGIAVEELTEFLDRHRAAGSARVVLLYGYQAEPTPLAQTNLARLGAMRARFPDLALGFLDHSDGAAEEAEWLGLLALPYGASVVEKHLTLERSLRLEDHISAVAPAEFRRYVGRVRAAAAALGGAELDLTPEEQAYRRRAVKAVVACRPLDEGATVSRADVALKRTALPDDARPLCRLADVLGRRTRRMIATHAAICVGDLV